MEHCKEPAPANGGQKPSLEQWKSLFLDATRMEGLEASPELKLSQKIQQLIQSAFVDKQFFLLGSHYIGLAPPGTETGTKGSRLL